MQWRGKLDVISVRFVILAAIAMRTLVVSDKNAEVCA